MARQTLAPSSNSQIDAFLTRAREGGLRRGKAGRLLFAMDATASREPTWDYASRIQAQMFEEAARTGELQVQLAWYGGMASFRQSGWVSEGSALRSTMESVRCAAGATQIGRVLALAAELARAGEVSAVVFVGDSMEESAASLLKRAGELRLYRVPMFLFQEGNDPVATSTFSEIARISGGAHLRFDAGSSSQLAILLRAAAAYATGGHEAMKAMTGPQPELVASLTQQLRGPKAD